jgi:hypothetical protein
MGSLRDPKGAVSSLLYGTHFAQSVNGNVFIGNQLPAGVAPALWSATTQQCGILNPTASGVHVVPIRIQATYVSGTGIVNGICLGYNAGASNGVDAAGTVTAATFITPNPAKLGGTPAKAKFMSAGITCIAPLRLMNLGMCTEVGATTAAVAGVNLVYDFDGILTIPPNYAVYIAADITAITAVYSFTLIWAEVPVGVENVGW